MVTCYDDGSDVS